MAPTAKLVKTFDATTTTLNLTALDFDGNFNAIAAVLERLDAEAAERGPVDRRVVVFPELCSTGPGAEDALLRPAVLKRALATTLAAAELVGPNVVAALGLPLAFEGAVYKAAAIASGGAVRGFVCASTLARPNEARRFAAWPTGKVATLNINGVSVPIGDLVFVEDGLAFAVRTLDELAADAGERLDPFDAPETLDEKTLYAAFAKRADEGEIGGTAGDGKALTTCGNASGSTVGEVGENGETRGTARLVVDGVLTDGTLGARRVDCVLCPNATPFAIGRRERIERILAKISRRDRNLIVYSTPSGVESGAAIFDGGSALALDGDVRTAVRFPFVAATFATNRVELSKTFEFADPLDSPQCSRVAQSSQNTQAVQNVQNVATAQNSQNAVSARECERIDGETAARTNAETSQFTQSVLINVETATAAGCCERTSLKSEVRVAWGDEEKCELEEGLEGWEVGPDAPFEEFARATALGLFDYMRKSRSRGFALSLSGGADSATIAALIRLGVKWGRRSLGTRLFLRWLARPFSSNGSLDAFPALAALDAEFGEAADAFENGDVEPLAALLNPLKSPQITANAETAEGADSAQNVVESGDRVDFNADDLEDALERRIVAPLLTTVYQATRNSGEITRVAAREVADFCGATHFVFNVDGIVEAYKELVADATGAPFDWTTDDLALQNIQARSRGPSVWLLANRSGRLLLSTGNRSEVACGYATMDGDTCGGLSPIAGIDKAFVRKWLVWAEKTGVLLDFDDQGNEIRFKAPALRFINEQQPTAELRPVAAKQTDEADLMPYAILNLFERALIRDRLELDAAISRVRTEAVEAEIAVDDETLAGWGVRFCRLWARTQWKRQRYAPGFPLDDYDLSPNSWTRFPILSEGFEREIADFLGR